MSAREISAGGHSIAWYIGASRAMPPISGENTSMKVTLVRLRTRARCAGTSSRWVIQATTTVTRTATGTISEMSFSHTASGLAKSESRWRASDSMEAPSQSMPGNMNRPTTQNTANVTAVVPAATSSGTTLVRACRRSTSHRVPARSTPGGFTIASQPIVIPAMAAARRPSNIAQAIRTAVPASTDPVR